MGRDRTGQDGTGQDGTDMASHSVDQGPSGTSCPSRAHRPCNPYSTTLYFCIRQVTGVAAVTAAVEQVQEAWLGIKLSRQACRR